MDDLGVPPFVDTPVWLPFSVPRRISAPCRTWKRYWCVAHQAAAFIPSHAHKGKYVHCQERCSMSFTDRYSMLRYFNLSCGWMLPMLPCDAQMLEEINKSQLALGWINHGKPKATPRQEKQTETFAPFQHNSPAESGFPCWPSFGTQRIMPEGPCAKLQISKQLGPTDFSIFTEFHYEFDVPTHRKYLPVCHLLSCLSIPNAHSFWRALRAAKAYWQRQTSMFFLPHIYQIFLTIF